MDVDPAARRCLAVAARQQLEDPPVEFALGWFVLGVQAIRLDRPAAEPRPA